MNQKLLMEEHLLITREELKRKLSIEARRIELRQEYQKYDKADLDFLIKKSPDHHNYSSNDFYNLGKWNLDNLIISHREKIFYHYDVKKKTKSIFKPSLLATYLQEKYPIVTIKPTQVNKNDPGDMWYYHPEKEMYVPNAELFFNQEIKKIWGDNFNTRVLNETYSNIRYETFLDRDDFELEEQYIPVQNGILWLIELEGELVIDIAENTPELFVTSRIPHYYDPDAECPRWIQFMDEILPGQQREIDWLQEYVGYCLYRKWDFDKVIMLHGDGKNGKSTFLDIVRNLLGKDNCTTIGLNDLCNGRWYTAELYKKIANIDADTASKDLENTSKFKTVTGGDTVMGERKGKNPFFFDSYAKHFMSCNQIPYCYDDTDAFYRRWLPIKFFVQFDDNDPKTDPQLYEKLEKEFSGILNWAIKGLLRLLKNNTFSDTPSTDEVKNEWSRLSNPLYSFVYSNNVVIDYMGHYHCEEFYNAFLEYCKRNNLVQWTKDKVGKRMNKHFDFVFKQRYLDPEYYNPSNPDYRVWGWSGIRKRTDEEKQLELDE